jgi:hypothetical protein
MTKQNKLNINVNKDDQNINDYLYSWSELGFRPSKNIIYKNYDTSSFLEFISPLITERTIQKDIIPFDDTDMVNERNFCKIDTSLWISFTIYDSLNEESFIGEVCFYYDPSTEAKIDDIIDQISQFEIREESNKEQFKSNLFSIFIGQSGFETIPIKIDDDKFDNIDCFYNDQVLKKIDKLSNKIKKNNKGLSIIYGERGVGKTSLVKYICSKTEDKDFLFIPTTLFDASINNSEFRNFIKKHNNSVIVLDDCEIYFSDLYSKSNIFTNNLLQLVDGLDSDELGLNLLLILNCERECDIDPHLIESNNLHDVVYVDYLTKNKISDLVKLIDKKNKFKTSTKLSHVLRNKSNFGGNDEIGFY